MTTPQPQGLPPLREIEPAFDHPEHHMKWTRSEIKWIKEYATDYASEALRAMPASRKDIEQAAFEKWLDKERPSGDVEQVQRKWEESSDYEEVQPSALLAEINHWHAAANKWETELLALRAQAASVELVAYMTEDGRVSMRTTVETAMPRAARESFTIPLYAGAPPSQASVPGEVGAEAPIRWELCKHCGHDMKEPCHHNANPNAARNCHWNQERLRVLGTGLENNRPDRPAPSPAQAVDADPLEDFQEGQWWIKELDSMVAEATPDQRRAVAVVHNLLRAASNTCQPQVQQGGSDTREALRLGVECLRNWKILHPEDFDELDERAVALLKAALTAKERK